MNVRGGQSSGPHNIRRAVQDDAMAIASVLYHSFVQFEQLYTPKAFAATVLSPEGVLQRLTEGPIWVGLLDDQIVATASAVIESDGVYVRGMGVVPEARGQRLGWRLLEHIEQLARDEDLGRLYLSTTPFLDQAIRLYEHYGFERTEEGPFDLFGTPLSTMVKDLGPAGEHPVA